VGRADDLVGLLQRSAAGSEPQTEEQRKEERRLQRDADVEARRQATAYNEELGIAIVKTLSKTKVDERVVQILAAVDYDGEFDKIAMRARPLRVPGLGRVGDGQGGQAAEVRVPREPRGGGAGAHVPERSEDGGRLRRPPGWRS
jgi:hypothetical protein